MNRITKKVAFLSLKVNILIFLSSVPCFAVAWTSKKVDMYTKLGVNYFCG